MLQKLFVLGQPGSGKSTISRHIVKYMMLHHEDWLAQHITDYKILYQMFKADFAKKNFCATPHNGFHVLKPSIYNHALRTLKWQIRQIENSLPPQNDKLLLVEFARSDYKEAFKQFGTGFLQNSFFLFLDADIDTCIYRIRERVANPTTEDDHFVSKSIFETYYQNDTKQYLVSDFLTDHRISKECVKLIGNSGSPGDILAEVNSFVEYIRSPDIFSPTSVLTTSNNGLSQKNLDDKSLHRVSPLVSTSLLV